MKFSMDKVNSLIKRLKLKPCPMCDGINWNANTNLNFFPQLDEANRTTDVVFPVLLLSCMGCGYTHMFSANVANLLE